MLNEKLQEYHPYTKIYTLIIDHAQAKATELSGRLPLLPTPSDIQPILGVIYANDKQFVDTIRREQERWNPDPQRGFDHLEWVASNAAYIAAQECQLRGITGALRDEILQRTWRLGYLHDIRRDMTYMRPHAEEGSKAAAQLLEDMNLQDRYLAQLVRVHDDMLIESYNLPEYDIPMFSVFAIDHLNWGLEWLYDKWVNFNRRNIDPQVAVHDYKFMYELLNSSNLQQTHWGRTRAKEYVQFGIDIAQHIEKIFPGIKASS